jgi:hypothetical protein
VLHVGGDGVVSLLRPHAAFALFLLAIAIQLP